MMTRSLRQIFRVQHQYANPIDRHRANVLLMMVWGTNLMIVGWMLFIALPSLLRGDQQHNVYLLAAIGSLVGNLIIYYNIQWGGLYRAVSLFVGMALVVTVVLTIFPDPNQPRLYGTMMLLLAIPVVTGGLLLNRSAVLLLVLALAIASGVGAVSQSQITTPVEINPADTLVLDVAAVVVTLGVLLMSLRIFAGNVERIAADSLEHINQRRWVAELGIELGKIVLAESVILARALIILQDRFPYYFAQVYMLDAERNRLARTMSTAMGQQEMADRGGFALGETNAVSECARLRRVVAAVQGGPGGGYLRPTSRFGVAVPMMHNQALLGVLDIQIAEDTPLSPTEIETLTLFAGQLGSGLANARQMGDLQRHTQEQALVINRLQEQVATFQEREQRSVSGAWSTYLQGRGRAAIGFDLDPERQITPVPAHDLPDDIRRTLEKESLYIETDGSEKRVLIPIIFRGQALGAMAFSLPADQELTSHQLEMTRVVSERLALALENIRLFEQSQAQALRERKAGQITGQLIGAKDIGALLNMAAESFNDVLGAVHTGIYLQPDLLAEPPASQREETAP